MKRELHVLMIEDSEDDLILLTRHLERQGLAPRVKQVQTEAELRQCLLDKNQPWDLILSDYILPGFQGIEALRILQEAELDIPFILISGVIGEDLAVEAMRNGAHDFIPKSNLTRLVPAIEREIREAEHRKQQRQSEANLVESEERYRALVEQSPDAIIMESSGQLVYANPAAVRLFGVDSPDPLMGREWIKLWHPSSQEEVRRIISAVYQTGISSQPFRARLLACRDSKEVEVEGTAALFQIDEKPALQVVLRDLTESLNLESQLLHAQKMEAVGQLAAGVAHDFNNLLTIIQGHASLLKSHVPENSPLCRSIEKIAFASERATALTRQLLAFSHKQVIHLRSLDLNEVVETVNAMINRLLREDISVECLLADNLPLIHGDSGMIEQVVMNLAMNARDAMPQGGRITIQTWGPIQAGPKAPTQLHKASGSYVALTVKDNGSGIAQEHLNRIFEPFFTTKEVGKGTGLGLATVYAIVEKHRGIIEVQSRVGEGTAFQIYFPVIKKQSATETQLPAPAPPAVGKDEGVLVVEDEPALLLLAEEVLSNHGYRVFKASSGPDAIKLWDSNPGPIHLLLTDVVMPGGMTGKQLAVELCSRDHRLKVVYMSGYSGEPLRSDDRATAHFLAKPYSPSDLLAIIRQCMDGSPVSRSPDP